MYNVQNIIFGVSVTKVVVFDAFNTIVKRNKKYVTEPYKLVRERATKAIFNPMESNISVREYAEAIGSIYSDDEMKDIEDKLALEISKITPLGDSLAVIEAVKRNGFITAIGSNLAAAYGPVLKNIFGDLIDEYYFSYDMGVVKPNNDFYSYIMADCAVKYSTKGPEDFFMVGDSLVNDYQTPVSMGWKAMQLSASIAPYTISRLNSIFLELNYRK